MSDWSGIETGGARIQVVGAEGRLLADPTQSLPAPLWRDLAVPVALAFVTFNRRLQRWTAVFPGPAGAVELALPADAWGEVALALPLLAELNPDAEALLISGGPHYVGGDSATDLEVFVAPLDICRRLIDTVSPFWRGFGGGDQAWRAVASVIDELRGRATLCQ